MTHNEAPDCPCGGWDCSAMPGGAMLGCPYPSATNGLTHFVPRTEKGSHAPSHALKAVVLKKRAGETSARIAEAEKDRRSISRQANQRKELIEWCAEIAGLTSPAAASTIRQAALTQEFEDERRALEEEILSLRTPLDRRSR